MTVGTRRRESGRGDAPAPRAGSKVQVPRTWLESTLALQPMRIWKFLQTQNAAFWSICFYLFIEYVRPQGMIASISGIPFGQISIIMAFLTLLLASGPKFATRSAITWLLLIFSAVVVLSTLQGYDVAEGQSKWMNFFNWVIIYFLIINIVNTEERFAVFMLSWLMYNFYMSQGATKQWLGRGMSFANWGVKGGPGFFENSGEFGIEMCVFLPLAWHFYVAGKPYLTKWKRWFMLAMPLTAVMAAIASSSRGALVGMGAVGMVELVRSKSRVKGTVAVVALAAIAWVAVPAEQKARFSESGDDTTSTRRLTYWQRGLDMAAENPVLGIGYGNWLTYYRDKFPMRRGASTVRNTLGGAQLPHNLFIECMAELGYVGLTALLMLIVATFVINHKTRKLARAGPNPSNFIVQMAFGLDAALVGYMASGFFVTVLYYPYLWINLAFTASLAWIARTRVPRVARPAPARSGAAMRARRA